MRSQSSDVFFAMRAVYGTGLAFVVLAAVVLSLPTHCWAAGPGERRVQFPEGAAMGSLSVRDWGSTEGGWQPLGNASGGVQVPAGKQLRLEMSGKQGARISALAGLPPDAIQSLRLEEMRLTPEQARGVAHLLGLSELELLKVRVDKDALKALCTLRNLKVLHVEDTGIAEGWLKPVTRLGALEDLSVKDTRAEDKTLAPVGKLGHLKTLDLSGTKITDMGLARLARLKTLETLNLFDTPVTDGGMRHLAGLTHLKKIDLPGTVGAGGVEALKGIPAHASLLDRVTFRLQVVEAETGRGIPGISVKISSDPECGLKKAATGKDGRCEFCLPSKSMRYFSVSAECDGRVPMKMAWEQSEGTAVPDSYTLPLPQGTGMGGIIVDEQKKPVQGARVFLLVPSDSLPWPRPAIWEHVVVTDESGKWRCDIMPEKLDDVWIKLSHPEFISDSMYGMTPKPPMEKLRDMTGEMVLKRGITLAGRVTDQDGNPVAGARVEQGEDRWGTDFPSTRTGKDGAFSFRNCKPGGMVLTVQKDGLSPDLRKLTVDKDMADVNFVLEKAHLARGRVVDKDGNPLAEVHVSADTWRNCRTLAWRGTTDAEGRFQWDSAPAEPVGYDILKEGFMSARRQDVAPGDTETTITLNRPLKISGNVVDAESGQPVPVFQLFRGIDWGSGGPVYWSRRDPFQGRDGSYSVTLDEPYPGQLVRVEAEGYLPAISRVFKEDEGAQVCDLKLEKGRPVKGTVRGPDGALLAGVEVVFCTPSTGAYFSNGTLQNRRDSLVASTDEQGAFSFPPVPDPYTLVVAHENGTAQVSRDAFEKDSAIRLQPWARIEGVACIGAKPAAQETIQLLVEQLYDPEAPRVSMQYQVNADDAGHFVFDRVVPGELRVCRGVKYPEGGRVAYSHGTWVDAKSGQTVQVKIGGTGCPVKGRVVLPAGETATVNWGYCDCWIRMKSEQPKPPANLPEDKARAWYADWQKSEAGKKFRREQTSYAGVIGTDGSFEIPDVPAGNYTIGIRACEPPEGRCGFGPEIGHAGREFRITEMPGGSSGTPMDLGTLELSLRRQVKAGMDAPDFEVKTLDGKSLKLSGLRGKYVLLDFWATWCGPCRGETPKLKEIHDSFGANPKFALVSLSLDPDAAAPRKYAKENGMNWTHGFLGDWQKTKVPDQFGVQGIPAIFLIDPEGKILASGLRGDGMVQAVRQALLGAAR